MAYPAECLALLITGVFAVSAFGKLRSRRALSGFVRAVEELGHLGPQSAKVAAAVVCTLEVLLAALSAVPATTRLGLFGAAVLLGVFSLALLRALRDRRGVSCNCFGVSDTPIAPRHLVRNLVLIALSVAVLLLGNGSAGGQLSLPGFLLCLLVAVVLVAAVALLDDLAALFGPLQASGGSSAARSDR